MSGKLGLTVGLLMLGLVGGCGDSSVVIIIGDQPPVVTATAPKNGAVNVEPTTSVSAVFSQAMNPATINTATFTLRTAAGPLAGHVGYDSGSRTASFTPDGPLPLLATCTATLSSAIRSNAGTNLPRGYIWSFTTREGNPTAPTTTAVVESPWPDSDPATQVFFADGSTLEAWLEPGDDGRQAVFAERYLAREDRWSIPPGSLSSPGENCREVVVVGDAEGNALVAWVSEGEDFRVEVSRYQGTSDHWLQAVTVGSETNRVSNLQIDVGQGGRFSLSWQVQTKALPLQRVLRFE